MGKKTLTQHFHGITHPVIQDSLDAESARKSQDSHDHMESVADMSSKIIDPLSYLEC